jgi:hypothetical protein
MPFPEPQSNASDKILRMNFLPLAPTQPNPSSLPRPRLTPHHVPAPHQSRRKDTPCPRRNHVPQLASPSEKGASPRHRGARRSVYPSTLPLLGRWGDDGAVPRDRAGWTGQRMVSIVAAAHRSAAQVHGKAGPAVPLRGLVFLARGRDCCCSLRREGARHCPRPGQARGSGTRRVVPEYHSTAPWGLIS